jgi:predicted nucleotidyltransferase
MRPEEYSAFTERLLASLQADPRVLGLIAVGSMARRDTAPDAWSDHDFLVVVRPGVQEELRTSIAWLPDHAQIAYRFRETAHGVKLLYASGHLLEYAIFDPDELHLGRFNRYRILLDRSDLARRMEEIVRATEEATRAEAPSDGYLIGQLLTNVLVAHGRWSRGEHLSARAFLGQAVTHLVRLLERHVPASAAAPLDNLDPLRRFELSYAALGASLDHVLARPLPAAAAGLLDVAERELAPRMPEFPGAALAAVRAAITS